MIIKCYTLCGHELIRHSPATCGTTHKIPRVCKWIRLLDKLRPNLKNRYVYLPDCATPLHEGALSVNLQPRKRHTHIVVLPTL